MVRGVAGVAVQELGVPEVQVHEPVLTLSHAAGLKDDFQKTFDAFASAGVRINLVTAYDDIGDAYEWAIKLPVQVLASISTICCNSRGWFCCNSIMTDYCFSRLVGGVTARTSTNSPTHIASRETMVFSGGRTLSVPSLSAVLVPVQAISLDFLGVPGSALGCATADLIAKHGFPQDKRLGAGIVDGRSVWADGDVPTALLGSLVKQVSVCSDRPASLQRTVSVPLETTGVI